MNESNKNQNNIDQHPIATIREGVADGENIALGIVFSLGTLFMAFVLIKIAFVVGISFLLLTAMNVCEIIRGTKSIGLKGLIHDYNVNPTDDLKKQIDDYDIKIKNLNKYKKYFLIGFIVVFVLGLIVAAVM